MQLTRFTDYTLRVLIAVGISKNRGITIAEISAQYGISKNHLMKVAHQLGIAGYVDTVRGRNGGLRLAKPAKAIGLGEVVRHTEPDMAIVMCFEPINADCAILPYCVLRKALEKARTAFVEALDDYNLSDLVRPRASLQAMLSIGPAQPPRLASAKERRRPTGDAR
jgi:Rrf2 family nitric oxide-sensitive transcriptional repressor